MFQLVPGFYDLTAVLHKQCKLNKIRFGNRLVPKPECLANLVNWCQSRPAQRLAFTGAKHLVSNTCIVLLEQPSRRSGTRDMQKPVKKTVCKKLESAFSHVLYKELHVSLPRHALILAGIARQKIWHIWHAKTQLITFLRVSAKH